MTETPFVERRQAKTDRRSGGSDRRAAQGLPAASVGVNPGAKRRFRLPRIRMTRILILALALSSGLIAARLATTVEAQPQVARIVPTMLPILQETEEVLVAATPLPLGKVLAAEDLLWQSWPRKAIGAGAVRRSAAATALDDMKGAIVRSAFIQGEPIRAEKVIHANGSGILAAILPSGYRALAINIDSQGANSAGGFILPNDRVDVIRTLSKADPSRPGMTEQKFDSETLLTNVRVLAIGQNIQERNGERVVTGSNATLEVAPRQAELLVLAQRTGQLSLALRSMSDAGDLPTMPAPQAAPVKTALTTGVVTVGVTRKGARQEYSVLDTQR